MAAMQMLHCTIYNFAYISDCGDQQGGLNHGFFTGMFARRVRMTSALSRRTVALHSMSSADRADQRHQASDFPRIAREISVR